MCKLCSPKTGHGNQVIQLNRPEISRRYFIGTAFALTAAFLPSPVRAILPDPYERIPNSNSSKLPETNGSNTTNPAPSFGKLGSQLPKLPPPSYARSIAEQVMFALDGLTSRVQRNTAEIDRLNIKIDQLTRELTNLKNEMLVALDELEKGLYCSQCNRPKSQIEREDRETFEQHLQRVNGRPIRAPQSLIDSKEREYTDKIAAKKKEIEYAIKQRGALLEENLKIWSQIQEGIKLWQTAVTLEENLIAAHEEGVKMREAQDVNQAEQMLKKIDEERRKLLNQESVDQADFDFLDSSRKLWEKVKDNARKDAKNKISYYLNDLKVAKEIKNHEFLQMGSFIQRTDAFSSYYRNTFSQFIPTFSSSLGPVSVFTAPDQLGAKFKFNNFVSGGISAGGSDAIRSTEINAFLELFSRVRINGGWRTHFSYDGVESSPTASFDITPPKDRGLPKVGDSKFYYWFDIGPMIYQFDPDIPGSKERALKEALDGMKQYKGSHHPTEGRGTALPAL